jgi:hypothetical protein
MSAEEETLREQQARNTVSALVGFKWEAVMEEDHWRFELIRVLHCVTYSQLAVKCGTGAPWNNDVWNRFDVVLLRRDKLITFSAPAHKPLTHFEHYALQPLAEEANKVFKKQLENIILGAHSSANTT